MRLWFLLGAVFVFCVKSHPVDLVPSENNEVPLVYRSLCGFVDLPGEEGDRWTREKPQDEGSSERKILKLRGFAVVIRHGDRSSLFNTHDNEGCRSHDPKSHKNFTILKQLFESTDFRNYISVDDVMKDYIYFPEEYKCVLGEMTAEGILQIANLGKKFYNYYKDTPLFTDKSHALHVMASASPWNRTLQTARSFVSQFLYPMKDYVPRVHVQSSNLSYQCFEQECYCPISNEMRYKFEDERGEYFELHAEPSLIAEAHEIKKTFAPFSKCHHPLAFVDIALGNFVCRMKPLPCKDGFCVTFPFLLKMLNLVSTHTLEMWNKDVGLVRRLQAIETYAILNYLNQAVEKSQRDKDYKFVRIYSSHDSVIGPLLRAMGLSVVDPCSYGARLVFEVYEHPSDGLFVRVLYNGEDMTRKVDFCQNKKHWTRHGLCSVEAFSDYVHKVLFQQANVRNVKEACYM
ncbi:unnamed protein product [Caenorhabditis auriculariae]|uniref:Uncharacterized protein n=1 Tax=Caenorhabditis auriculariae TaxID=2777116 RepID=A0A8S1GUV3_9PELO|nr:unnamed protein product [Caenorhabditis auriculariae]